MIVLTITDRIKAPVYQTPAPFVNNYAPSVNTAIFLEAQRRDKLMKDLVRSFNHVVGDTVVPKNEADAKTWGKCTIMGICSEYIHLEKDFKWPKNDNPMIITCSSETGEIFYATTNYFK